MATPEQSEVEQVPRGYVLTADGRWLVQLPSDNQWGFELADDGQTWPGGHGCGSSEWTLKPVADVPADVRERLGWLLDPL